MTPMDCNLLPSPVYRPPPLYRERVVGGPWAVRHLFSVATPAEEGEPTEDHIVAKLLRAASPEDLQALLRALHINLLTLGSPSHMLSSILAELKLGGSPLYFLLVIMPSWQEALDQLTWAGRPVAPHLLECRDQPRPVLANDHWVVSDEAPVRYTAARAPRPVRDWYDGGPSVEQHARERFPRTRLGALERKRRAEARAAAQNEPRPLPPLKRRRGRKGAAPEGSDAVEPPPPGMVFQRPMDTLTVPDAAPPSPEYSCPPSPSDPSFFQSGSPPPPRPSHWPPTPPPLSPPPPSSPSDSTPSSADSAPAALDAQLEQLARAHPAHQRELIMRALELAHGNVAMAGAMLAATRPTSLLVSVAFCLRCQTVGQHFATECPHAPPTMVKTRVRAWHPAVAKEDETGLVAVKDEPDAAKPKPASSALMSFNPSSRK